jgi:hypothetical protein
VGDTGVSDEPAASFSTSETTRNFVEVIIIIVIIIIIGYFRAGFLLACSVSNTILFFVPPVGNS